MKIGIIGLGDIAQKAYLPVITALEGIELVFCTRNRETLDRLSAKYRVPEAVESVEELISLGVNAAFIHSSTESHAQIAEQLIRSGIHVYVDKPISYHYGEAERLTALAEELGFILMVGFNRRFAPMHAAVKDTAQVRSVFLQKNRLRSPDYARRFVYDDFIHVVDTIRYLAPGQITKPPRITTFVEDGKLVYVQLQLEGQDFLCTGVMNRDSGANDEVLEVMSPGNKWVIESMNTTVHYEAGQEQVLKFKDWDPVLYRRGFVRMIDHFLDCVQNGRQPIITMQDALESHRICELIVLEAERNNALPWGLA